MNLRLQKKLASKITGVGLDKVKIDPEAKEEVEEAITKEDVRDLINEGIIRIKESRGVSRGRAREDHAQRKKGRRRGQGRRRGKSSARGRKKNKWLNKVRAQRRLLKSLREEDRIKKSAYREIYDKIKGNFFRSKKHLKMYLDKNNLLKE